MDKFDQIKRLRDEYESALDEADRIRNEYHREIVKLHRSGMTLREIAEGLGISHQRVHQIVSPHEEQPRSRTRRRAVGAVGGVLLLLVAGSVVLSSGSGQRALQSAEPSPSAMPVTPSCVASSENLHSLVVRRCGHRAAIVAIDPRTGDVLAMMSGAGVGDLPGLIQKGAATPPQGSSLATHP